MGPIPLAHPLGVGEHRVVDEAVGVWPDAGGGQERQVEAQVVPDDLVGRGEDAADLVGVVGDGSASRDVSRGDPVDPLRVRPLGPADGPVGPVPHRLAVPVDDGERQDLVLFGIEAGGLRVEDEDPAPLSPADLDASPEVEPGLRAARVRAKDLPARQERRLLAAQREG